MEQFPALYSDIFFKFIFNQFVNMT